MDKVICFDNAEGDESVPSDDIIQEYLKAVDIFKDILKDTIKEIEDKKDDSDDNGYEEL